MNPKERLVPIAEFDDPADADRAWTRLDEEGIPSSVVTDKAMLGGRDVTRVYVEEGNVARGQAVLADLM